MLSHEMHSVLSTGIVLRRDRGKQISSTPGPWSTQSSSETDDQMTPIAALVLVLPFKRSMMVLIGGLIVSKGSGNAFPRM